MMFFLVVEDFSSNRISTLLTYDTFNDKWLALDSGWSFFFVIFIIFWVIIQIFSVP